MVASISGLTVRYGRRVAVDNVSFALKPGQITLLLGPNGAGKSTTLSAISGAISPNAGSITIDGELVNADSGKSKAKIGFADQPPSLYEFFTVAEHVGFVAQARTGSEQSSGVEQTLAALGLSKIAARPCRELSFGMRQRVGLAAALIGSTKVILLDETLNGLDPHATRHAIAALHQARNAGASVLMSTHLLGSAERACDRVLLMSAGKIIADLEGEELASLLAKGPTALEDFYVDRIPDDGPS